MIGLLYILVHTFLVLRPPSSGLKIHHHQRPQKAQLTQLNVNVLESQGEKQNGQNTTHRREDVNAIVKLHPRNFLMQPAESSILRQPFTGSTKLIPCVLSTGLATLVTVTPPTHRRSRILTHCWDYCTRRDCCRRTRGCKEGQAAARARLAPSGASSGRSGHNSPTSTNRVGVGEGRVEGRAQGSCHYRLTPHLGLSDHLVTRSPSFLCTGQ